MRMPIEERRAALVEATLAVVERDGLSGTSARTIVRQAGMPLGALHYAFDSLDGLLAAAVDAVTEQERLAVEHLMPAADTVEDRLEAGLAAYVDLLTSRPARELAFLELMLHASRARLAEPPAPGRYAPSYAVVEALLADAADRAGATWTTAPATLARHTVAMLDGITTTWLADHDTAAAHANARFLAASLAAHAHQEG
ncbi:TetR/AcrR family transcriptional regulator [Demequina silvatica]|uniref:TetR/AcrR family transcriptional regulator n=1 Tax=Demequina silvatica TaxID=1638988 RepID=UPI0007855BBB|nr:TetR family transcriptional regulator [Demequina silvatica]